MKLLLDAASFLWYITADARLPAAVAEELRSADNAVYLSAATVWEILAKHRLGRLKLPEPPAEYIPRQRERHGILSLPIDEASASQLNKLPSVNRDPFDRVLVCQAIEHDLAIVSGDPAIHAYPVKTLWRA